MFFLKKSLKVYVVLTVAERGRDGELKAFGTRYWISSGLFLFNRQ